MSLFTGEGAENYTNLRQRIISSGKQGYAQSEINKYLVGNPYLTKEIIKLVKIEIMKKILEIEL